MSLFITPTDRNLQQILTYDGSKDVIWPKDVPFGYAEVSKSHIRDTRAQKRQNFNQILDLANFQQKISLNMGASESKHPLNVKIHPQNLHFKLKTSYKKIHISYL